LSLTEVYLGANLKIWLFSSLTWRFFISSML